METITEFAFGDKIYALKRDRIVSITVKSILLTEQGVFYSGRSDYANSYEFPEAACYATLKELVVWLQRPEERDENENEEEYADDTL